MVYLFINQRVGIEGKQNVVVAGFFTGSVVEDWSNNGRLFVILQQYSNFFLLRGENY